jgi:hypothetical protein
MTRLCFLVATSLLWMANNLLAAEPLVLAEQGDLQWRRGNLHTHSHWSDGDDYLESIALWYREHDYDFLVFTDHNVLADTERWVPVDKTKGGRTAFDKLKKNFPDWVETREVKGVLEVRLRRYNEVAARMNQPGEFLLIQGEEISDHFQRKPIHLCASNVVDQIDPQGGSSIVETIQNNVRALVAQRQSTGQPMIIHVNHPNFGYAITAEELMLIDDEPFFEVYNGHPTVYNKGNKLRAGTDKVWDIILAHRLKVLGLPIMYGLANDDGHAYHEMPSRASNPGRGWVQVLSAELTPAALIEALEAGKFYATSGVTLNRVEYRENGMAVEIDPKEGETYTIEFIGTRRDTSLDSTPVIDDDGNEIHATRRYSDKVGEILATVEGTKAEYTYAGDELYVRARITSSALHPNPSEPGDYQQAWVQPVLGPGAGANTP